MSEWLDALRKAHEAATADDAAIVTEDWPRVRQWSSDPDPVVRVMDVHAMRGVRERRRDQVFGEHADRLLAIVQAAERVAEYVATIRRKTGDCPICGDAGEADHMFYCPLVDGTEAALRGEDS